MAKGSDRAAPRFISDALPPLNFMEGAGNPPSIPFWHMKDDGTGQCTIESAWLEGFAKQVVSGKTVPIWMRSFPGQVKAVWFNVLPVGWIGDWHPSPSLQWVVPLSGRWFIETQNGRRVEMGPGDIHWGADIVSGNSADIAHLSGQIGDVPCVQLMVQFLQTSDPDVTIPSAP